MLQSLKVYDLDFKKQLISVEKSGWGRVVNSFFDFRNDFWGGYPAVTSIQNSINSSKPLPNDNSNSFSPVGTGSILDIVDAKYLSNEKESNELSNQQEISKCQEENDTDTDNSECDLQQHSGRRTKVQEMLNERKDKKITTKFSQEAQRLHSSKEDLQLKKKLFQDKRLQENLNSANAIMSNIGVAIQQVASTQTSNSAKCDATDVYAYEFPSPSTVAFPAGFF